MQIKTTYVGTLKGISGIWCGFLPKGVKVKEERQVLYPEANYYLRRIGTDEVFSSVWLKDNDVQENYEEIIADEEIKEE